MAAYAGSKEGPDPDDWFPWRKADDPAHAGAQAGPGIATEEEIREAWGDAYDEVSDAGQ